jgi:hypothetical protein
VSWITSTYMSPTSDTPLPVLINLNHVRSIRRTAGGKVRINWAYRIDPMILDEEWDHFIKHTWTT